MRPGLLAVTLAAILAPPAFAVDPVIVYQTQPLGRLLEETRSVVSLFGGDKAVKKWNANLKDHLGAKGFEGFDLSRPVVGYITLPADPEEAVAVVAFPTTGEKAFLEFCERWNHSKPKTLGSGLYEVPPIQPGLKAVMRFINGYAYVAVASKDPAQALDPKTAVPIAQLYDPTETALTLARLHFDRIPKELRSNAGLALELARKKFVRENITPDTAPVLKLAVEQVFKLAARYVELSKGAKDAAVRLTLDSTTGDTAVEVTLTAVPGSPLDKLIAARKPGMNRFAGLIASDTAFALTFSLPLFAEEIRTAAVEGLESLRKEAGNNVVPPSRALLDELLKGLARTAKAGEFDFATVTRGPDKKGAISSVTGLSFDDSSGMEKELKKWLDAVLPEEFQELLKWDADKANGVSIHTFDLTQLPNVGAEELKSLNLHGVLAFAFAPKAIYLTTGPDAVAVLKAALTVKPAESPVLNVVMNPNRMAKLLADTVGRAGVEKILGTGDKPFSVLSLAVAGGKDLRVKVGLNLRVFGALANGFNSPNDDAVPPELK